MDSNNTNDGSTRSQPGIFNVCKAGTVPIVRIAGFLPRYERDALFNAACADKEAFQSTGTFDTKTGGTRYLPLKSGHSGSPVTGPVREACDSLSSRILKKLPTLFTSLGVDPFPVSKIPLTLVSGLTGHSGSPHSDESGGRFKISLLYYFHKTPRAFSGGDLEFFNTEPASPCGHSDEVLARINHEDNLLVAFPSVAFHGITEVYCDSNEFADGRFAAIGFLGPQ